MKKQILVKLIGCTIFVAASLHANEQTSEEKVVVGNDTRTFQEEIAVEQNQKKEEVQFREETDIEIQSPEEKTEVVSSGSYDDQYYEGCFHYIALKGANGEMFDIQDGSTWSVRDWDRHQVLYWNEGDGILIGTSSYFFSTSMNKASYRFEAFNRRNGARVQINLSQGPLPSKCRAIVRTDFSRVYLNDGSCWEISGFDSMIIRKWRPTHSIILGINNTLDSAWNPYILINVDTNDYVRARQAPTFYQP